MKRLLLSLLMVVFVEKSAYAQYIDFSSQTSPYSAIVFHAKRGNLNALKAFTKQGYSLDTMNGQGNTPLCDMTIQQNSLAIQTLLKAGTNSNANCMKRIPADQKEVFDSIFEDFDDSSILPASKIAMGAGIAASAALVAGGIAYAVDSGGGNSSSKKKQKEVSCTTSERFDGLSCIPCPNHSSSTGGKAMVCTCNEGWTGESCDVPDATCTGNSSIPMNCAKSKQCLHGDAVLFTCTECSDKYAGDNCDRCTTGYDFHGTTGCHRTLNCNTAHGFQQGDSCKCNDGWQGDSLCNIASFCDASYKPADSCGQGYHTTSKTCLSGSTLLTECLENSCTGYIEGSCPPNAEDCQTCWQGSKETYLFTKCKPGWNGDRCTESISCGDGYLPLTNCPPHATCSAPCQSGDEVYIKITACDQYYQLNNSGTLCVLLCPENTYASSETCLSCPERSSSLPGSVGISSCQCAEGWTLQGNQCVQVDFANIGENPANNDPSSYVNNSEFKKGNFLNQINAQYAYAKGYNGYLANKDLRTGELISNELTSTKIKVGIWDASFDVNQPDLVANIATREFQDGTTKTYGYNTQIGPCRNGDTTNCYGIIETDTHPEIPHSGHLVWYDGNGVANIISTNDNWTEESMISRYLKGSTYADDYDWDNESIKYNVEPGTTSISKVNNTGGDHGTHVAGIVGATQNSVGIQGVAPNAQLYLATWTNDNIHGIDKYYAAQYFANSEVRVVNASFGQTSGMTASQFAALSNEARSSYLTEGVSAAYRTYASNDIAIVRSAMNEGQGGQNESFYEAAVPTIPEFSKGGRYDLTNLFVNVVSVDKRNALATYSLYCGASAPWCIAAPGGDATKGSYILNALLTSLNTYGDTDHADIQLDTDVYKEDITWMSNLAKAYYNGSINSTTTSQRYASYWGITSTVKNDSRHPYITDGGVSYGIMQGTSMAAPVVTGSLALLMSAYPHLTTQQAVEILFRSANKNLVGWGSTFQSGTLENDWVSTTVTDTIYKDAWEDSFGNKYDLSKIYGHGMIDLKAATEPLGELKTPTTNSVASKQSLNNTMLALPRNINTQLTKSASTEVLGLDDYDRAFATSFEGKIKQAYHNPNSFKRDFKSFMSKSKIQTAGIKDKLSFAFSSTKTDHNLMGMGILDVNYQFNDTSALKFSYRSDMLNENRSIDKALSNPFMNMTDSYTLAQQFKWKDLAFTFGATTGKNAFYETDENKDDEFKSSVHAFNSEIAYRPNKSVVFKVIGGMMQEKEAILGINGTGVLATDDGKTYFTGTTLEYSPISPLTLSASYYYGRSSIPKTKGLIHIDNVISDSFAFDARYKPDDQKTFGVQFSSPLRIRKGNATFNLPVARDLYTDAVYFDKQKASLKPNAREYDLGVYYMTETDHYDWRGELVMRLNPDHMAGAGPDYRAMFGLSYKY